MVETPEYNCGVYSITSPSGNMYIGSSQNIKKRWREHRNELSKNIHHSQALQRAWDKYDGNLGFKLLLVCEVKDLITYEQQYMDFYQPKYNICKTAGSALGFKHSDETREKMSKSHVGLSVSEESRKKISESKKGRPRPRWIIEKMVAASSTRVVSEEERLWRSENYSGENHPCFGKKLSDETKKKIGDANRGKVHSEETKEKLRITSTGRFPSKETKEKLSMLKKQWWADRKNEKLIQSA